MKATDNYHFLTDMIRKLSKDTIDKIAAGEVVERPMSIVKELVENSLDADSDSITVEIKNGGIDMIRVTDNGCGISCDEVRTAFEAHATSKITDADDLMMLKSLGFRGEALSSIAAVTRCEVITKTSEEVTAVRYLIEGGNEMGYSEIGAPDGTTIITRELFFNVPARKKFLKTGMTEAAHIAELVEKLALSHPDVSFRFINNNQIKLQSSGNGSLKDVIYRIYGRDITGSLIEVNCENERLIIKGFIGKPEVNRPNRNFENYFVNGRYIKSNIISKALEDAYGNRMMQHQFPFAVLIIDTDPAFMDVNVHPTKMEVRFADASAIYDDVLSAVRSALDKEVLIPHIGISDDDKTDIIKFDTKPSVRPSEPFEKVRSVAEKTEYRDVVQQNLFTSPREEVSYVAESDLKMRYRIIGQVFSTYWILELEDKMFLMDQHAAHEKIYYERLLTQYKKQCVISQNINPPIIVTLTDSEGVAVSNHINDFEKAGYEIEHFGGNEYAIRSIPTSLPSVEKSELFKELISEYVEDVSCGDAISILEKTASMACKAAIKGGQRISYSEAERLADELFKCENPYSCPHGRPTMIEFTKSDLEKKFKRIV